MLTPAVGAGVKVGADAPVACLGAVVGRVIGGGAGSVVERPFAAKYDAQISVSTTSKRQLPLAASFKRKLIRSGARWQPGMIDS